MKRYLHCFLAVAMLPGLFVAQLPAQEGADAPEAAAAAEESATLVFFRPKRFVGSGLTPSVFLDDAEIARLDNGRHFSIRVKPGKHTLHSSMKKHAPVEFEAKAGETLYFEMVILSGNWRGGGRLIPAPAEESQAAMKKLKPLDKKWLTVPENQLASTGHK